MRSRKQLSAHFQHASFWDSVGSYDSLSMIHNGYWLSTKSHGLTVVRLLSDSIPNHQMISK